ncbi:MAG: hypothetical protein ACK5B3_10770 [Bacteroidota bacterium]|jgi:hypothetical protein
MNKIGFHFFVGLCILNIYAKAQTFNASDNSIDQLIYSKIDYNQLSDDVKQKINQNKLAGVSLFDGVSRCFVIDVSTVNSTSDIDKKLTFLKSVTNFKKVNYLFGNRIEIIASIDTEAALFKELFLTNDLNTNFIDQKFVVYKAK